MLINKKEKYLDDFDQELTFSHTVDDFIDKEDFVQDDDTFEKWFCVFKKLYSYYIFKKKIQIRTKW